MSYEHGKMYVYDATSQTFDLAVKQDTKTTFDDAELRRSLEDLTHKMTGLDQTIIAASIALSLKRIADVIVEGL